MNKIVECNQEVIGNVSYIEDILYDIYGDKSFSLFAFKDGEQMSFVSRKGLKCYYIKLGDKIEFKPFGLDIDGNLLSYLKDGKTYGMSYYDGYEVTRLDENGLENSLRFIYDNVNEDYGGLVLYIQRKSNGDICEMHYNHPINLRLSNGECHIFSYHLKNYNFVSLEENTKEFCQRRRIIKDFGADTLEEGTLSYLIGSRKEEIEGREKFKKRKELIYIPIYGSIRNDSYLRTWPLGEQYREEQIKEMIRRKGFLDSVPKDMLELYNQEGEYEDYLEMQKMCEQMREVNSESGCKKKMLINLKK